jgi:hypothetical protein
MTKKIFDILPPQLKSPLPLQSEPPVVKKKKDKESKNQHPFFKKIVLIAVLFFGLVALISSQAQSEITIQPFRNSLTIVEELRISHQVEGIDFENKIIPAEFFEVEEETWQEFTSTGESSEGRKAEGYIRVYNSHNPPRSITLRATTRFLSSDGSKYFRSPERIYIPVAKIENKKIVPSFVDVKVEAMEVGEDYNIGPSKFSLPGFVGTSYYYTIYGESSSPMIGGFKEEIKIVTEEDVENAKNSLNQSLLKQAQDSLKGSLTEDFVLLSSATFDEELESSCLQKAGAETPQFICQGKIKIKYLVFKESFLKEISKRFVLSEISNSEKLIEELLSFEYLQDKADLKKEEIILKFKILAEIYKEINEETLKLQIKKKTEKEVEDIIFNNFSGIEKVKVKFWPFWIRKTPNNLDRIKIKLDLGT